MSILERLGKKPPVSDFKGFGKLTTLKDRRVTFTQGVCYPLWNIANTDIAGIIFRVSEHNKPSQSIWIWYSSNLFEQLHEKIDDQYSNMKEQYLTPIFQSIKEAVFYEKITDQTIEIMLGQENQLDLKFDGRITYPSNENYKEELYGRVAYEICKELKPRYGEKVEINSILYEIHFSPQIILDVFKNPDIKESDYWDLHPEDVNWPIERKSITLTELGCDYAKTYVSPLDTPQAEADLGLEVVKSTIFTPPEILFVADEKIRDILKRDWVEIQKNIKVENWKSAIVLCGGVLEAVLYDILQQQKAEAKTSRAKLAPTNEDISTKTNIGSWNLYTLIAVATDLKLISNIGEGFTAALRDYRNLIHPRKEAMGNYKIREHEANVSFHALQAIVDDLEENVESIG